MSQQLIGAPAAGTYTFQLLDVGIATFGDNANAQIKFGLSLDGTNMISGAEMTLTEGTEIFSPDTGAVGNFSVSYTANAIDPLYLMIETTGNHTGRSVPTIGSCTLGFVPAANPDPTFLIIESGVGTITISCTNLSALAGVTNTLQSCDNLLVGNWVDVSSAAGVSETNWIVPTTNSQGFYRIEGTN